jgi:WD40 repeat protein
MWNVKTGSDSTLTGDKRGSDHDQNSCVAFSPDGNVLAAGWGSYQNRSFAEGLATGVRLYDHHSIP